jgi:hypothetical protein
MASARATSAQTAVAISLVANIPPTPASRRFGMISLRTSKVFRFGVYAGVLVQDTYERGRHKSRTLILLAHLVQFPAPPLKDGPGKSGGVQKWAPLLHGIRVVRWLNPPPSGDATTDRNEPAERPWRAHHLCAYAATCAGNVV